VTHPCKFADSTHEGTSFCVARTLYHSWATRLPFAAWAQPTVLIGGWEGRLALTRGSVEAGRYEKRKNFWKKNPGDWAWAFRTLLATPMLCEGLYSPSVFIARCVIVALLPWCSFVCLSVCLGRACIVIIRCS